MLKKILTLEFWENILIGVLRPFALVFFNASLPRRVFHWFFATWPRRALASVLIILIIIAPIYFAFFAQKTQAAWWNDMWKYRKKITIDHTKVAGELQNFPVLVSLSDTNLKDNAQADGDDIVFADANGQKLSHEIESYVAGTGALVAWVKIPFLTNARDQDIYVYYGNSTATSQQDSENVWDANFKMVQHMSQDPSGTAPQMTDSTSNDNDGTSNGTMLTEDLVDAKIGKGLDFDGVSDYIDHGDGTEGEKRITSDFTLSSWVTMASVPASYAAVINNRQSYALEINNGYIYFGFYNGSAWADINDTSQQLQAGNTYHLSGVFDNTADQFRLYINGSPADSTVSISDTPAESSGNLVIGAANNGAASRFPGIIDEARVSSTARSSEWIATEYANQNSPSTFLSLDVRQEDRPGAPVGYWSFDEGQGGTAHDETSNRNDGTITGATWKPESECVSGKCLWLNGTDNKIRIPHSASDKPKNITINTWVKANPNTVDYSKIVSLPYTTGSMGSPYYSFALGRRENNGYTQFIINTGGQWYEAYDTSGTEWNSNKWFMATLTYDGNTLRGYINSKEVAVNQDPSGDIDYSGGNADLSIGMRSEYDAAEYFKGFIDEPKVYPYARSADQIKQDYNAGLASQSALQGASAAFGSESTKWMTDGLVGHWKMDETSWNGTSGEVIDASGNDNNGTSAGGATTVGGKYGNGGVFDGVDDRVDCGSNSSLDNLGARSVCAWIKPTTRVSSFPIIVDKSDNGMNGWNLYLTDGNGIGFYQSFGVGNITAEGGGGEIVLNSWQYICLTYDGALNTNGLKIYLNKEPVSFTPFSTASGVREDDSNHNLNLGNTAGNAYDYNGQLDEVRIYNRALSPDEVRRLYEWAPGPVGHWKMDEKNGVTAYDTSGNGNDGGIYLASWDLGRYGSALKFDGGQAEVYVDDDPMLDMESALTISAWVKPLSSNINFSTIISKGANFGLQMTMARELDFYFYDGGWIEHITTGLNMNIGEWHYVSASFDESADRVKIYVNGINVYDGAETGNTTTDNSEFKIGDSLNAEPFDGLIDDVRVYDYARTASQIAWEYNKGKPIAHWKMDEGESGDGDTIHDESGNANHSTTVDGGNNTGMNCAGDGKFGKACDFDGVDDYVNIPDNATIEPTGNFSISAWFKQSTSMEDRTIIHKPGDAYQNDLYMQVNSGQMTVYVGGNAVLASPSSFLPANVWYHVTLVNNGTNIFLFKNGQSISTGSSYSMAGSSLPMQIGVDRDGISEYNEYFNGQIDDVRIYNYALTAEQVKQVMNEGAGMRF